jgi:hypothetical protein
MSVDTKDGPPRRARAGTIQGVGPAAPVAPTLPNEARSKDAAFRRESAPTDLGFVPPPDAPKVEVSPELEKEAVLAAAFPQAKPKPVRRPAAATELMEDVQRRRREQERESSDLPLKLALGGVAVLIAVIVTVIAYMVLRGPS